MCAPLRYHSPLNTSTADYRRGEHFRELVGVNNSSTSVWQSVTVTTSGGATNTGNVFVPVAKETYGYDADGNLTNDGRWTFKCGTKRIGW